MEQNQLILIAAFENYRKALVAVAVNCNNFMYDDDEDEEIMHKIQKFLYNKPARITDYIINVVNYYDEIEFQQNFRLKRIAFEHLLKVISENDAVENAAGGRPQVDLKAQLLSVIWLLATPDSYRSVSERFNMSKGMLSKFFVKIINSINSVIGKFIKWPRGRELEIAKLKFSSNSIFKNLIGAIDGTYIPLSVAKRDIVAYTHRKCYTSMTLQAICDAEMRFIDIFTGWPSSVPDVRIFKNSHIFHEVQQNKLSFFPNEEYIIGDKAYPILDWCIPPYMNRGNVPQTSTQIRFNKKHSSCRQVVERSFALLFGRFRRLKKLDMHRTDWVPATITACCVLHNICLDYDDDVLNDYIVEGLPFQEFNRIDENHLPVGNNTIYESAANRGSMIRDAICNQIVQ